MHVQLDLSAGAGVAVRSNPTGGEQGDGEEVGKDYENRIASVVAFFYEGVDGANSPAATPIQAVASFDCLTASGGGRRYVTEPVSVMLKSDVAYHVLAVANTDPGDWSSRAAGGLTLGDLQTFIRKKAWVEKPDGGYGDFVMASAKDATLAVDRTASADNPLTVAVDVERHAVRVDYKAAGSYTCEDPDYKGSRVELLGAAVVNDLTVGCYLLKRVADDVAATGGVDFLGKERPGQGVSQNYVIDPWTHLKTEANRNGEHFPVDGADRPAAALYGTYFNSYSDDAADWDRLVQPGEDVGEGWLRMGYTLENTADKAHVGKAYSTGVVFKARFHPVGLDGYTDGETFFAWGKTVYRTVEDIMRFYWADAAVKFDDFGNRLAACATWGEVKALAGGQTPGDPAGYVKYLQKAVADKADNGQLVPEERERLQWAAYMQAECGYALSAEGKVAVDGGGRNTRKILEAYGTRVYKDALCYYTWWVRHSNDGDDSGNGVMEYAVVRNNIYKLEVKSIYALGETVPRDENIVVRVYVKNWLVLPEETLEM